MIRKISVLTLVVSIAFSSWLYWGSDLKLKQEISSHEWQSRMVTVLEEDASRENVGPLRKVDVTSNVKYLTNGTYIRVSNVILFAEGDSDAQGTRNLINISETGNWDINDSYLLVSPTQFENLAQGHSKEFTPEELKVITQIFRMEAQQSRRIDIVNSKTLLLTSLSHGSTVLFSN